MSAWAIPVPLLPDELFSSWLVRAALMQGCDPLVLTGELWPKWRIWTIDPDRGLSKERLFDLEKASGIKASVFDTACLRAIASVVTTEPLDDLAIWRSGRGCWLWVYGAGGGMVACNTAHPVSMMTGCPTTARNGVWPGIRAVPSME